MIFAQMLLIYYLSSSHEKFVELVRLTFEKECLGRILVQQSDWVVNLDVETSLDPLQFLLDSFVHHNLALVIFQLVRTAPISRDCSKNNDAIAEQTLKERENKNQKLIFAYYLKLRQKSENIDFR